MTLIGEFDPTDQLLLMQGLEATAVLISTASLGRKEETASEGIAMATYVLDSARDQIGYHPLLMSIIRALEDRAAGGGAFPAHGTVVTAPDARTGRWASSGPPWPQWTPARRRCWTSRRRSSGRRACAGGPGARRPRARRYPASSPVDSGDGRSSWS